MREITINETTYTIVNDMSCIVEEEKKVKCTAEKVNKTNCIIEIDNKEED